VGLVVVCAAAEPAENTSAAPKSAMWMLRARAFT
jgi:hypothetical protein